MQRQLVEKELTEEGPIRGREREENAARLPSIWRNLR